MENGKPVHYGKGRTCDQKANLQMKILAMLLLTSASCASLDSPDDALHGTFEPALEDEGRADPAIEVTSRGWYDSFGKAVWVSVDIMWENTDPELANAPLRVQLPIPPAEDYVQSVSGTVRLQQLGDVAPKFVVLGTNVPVTDPRELNISLEIFTGTMVVTAAETTIGGKQGVLSYGTGPHRIAASLIYPVE